MFNSAFFQLGNFITLSIIILIWITIHEKIIKPRIIKG